MMDEKGMRMNQTTVALILCTFVGFHDIKAAELPEEQALAKYHPPYSEWVSEKEGHKRHIEARSHNLHAYPFVDGQWFGIITDRGGNVWFSVSSHGKDYHAQLFRYDIQEKKVMHIACLGQATGEKLTGNATQDKIHGRMFQIGDSLYTATCDGLGFAAPNYKGGYWIKIDVLTGEITHFGRSKTGDGFLCVAYDSWRNILYGMTNRTGELVRFDPETGQETILGIPWKQYMQEWRTSEDPDKPDQVWPRDLTLMVSPDGTVYGARPPAGIIWQYDPDTGKIGDSGLRIPAPESVRKGNEEARKEWELMAGKHTSVWAEEEQCFYFIRRFDETLMRFSPPTDDSAGKLEEIQKMGVIDGKNRYGNRPASCGLVLNDRMIYYTPGTHWGGWTYLQGFNLDTGELIDYGPIVVEEDRMVAESHSMTVGLDGRLFMVGFVYNIKNRDPVAPWAMRGGKPFHPRLIIVDPEEDQVIRGETN